MKKILLKSMMLLCLIFVGMGAWADTTVTDKVVTFNNSTAPTGWTTNGTFNTSYYKMTTGKYVETTNITELIPAGEELSTAISVDISCGTFGTWSGAKSVKATVSLLDKDDNVLSSNNQTYSTLTSSETAYRGAIVVSKPSEPNKIAKFRIVFDTFTTGTELRFKNLKFNFSTETSSVIPSGDTNPYYKKVTSQNDIVPGATYLIVCEDQNTAMGSQSTNRRNNANVTISNGIIRLDGVNTTDKPYEVTLGTQTVGANTYYTMILSNNKYLGNGTTSSNHLKEVASYADGYGWELTYNSPGGDVTMTTNCTTKRSLCVNTSNSTDSYATYTSIGSYKKVTLYKKQVVSLNAACTDGDFIYGTYSNTSNWVVPENLIVSEVCVADGELYIYPYEEGDVVPANAGVMVAATEAGDYSIALTTSAATASPSGGENSLVGTGNGVTAAQMTKADTEFFRLTMHNGETIGFFWGADNGAAFALGANKAYLAVATDNLGLDGAAKGTRLWINNSTTGIKTVNTEATTNKAVKRIVNGQLVIEKAGKMYNAAGAEMK